MTIVEFLLARITEDEVRARHSRDGDLEHLASFACTGDECRRRYYVGDPNPTRTLAECAAKRRIIEFHRDWPVLVEQQPTFEQALDSSVDGLALRMSQQIAWLTEQEYRHRFGTEPPTTPMLAALAAVYADHPDYQQEWKP